MSITIHHPTNRPNFTILNLDGLSVAFSYSTPIAFRPHLSGWTVRQNDWGATAGRHLNFISPDKSRRIPGSEFVVALRAAIADAGLDERIGL